MWSVASFSYTEFKYVCLDVKKKKKIQDLTIYMAET